MSAPMSGDIRRIIYKYPCDLSCGYTHTFRLPAESQILDIKFKNGIPTIWVEHPVPENEIAWMAGCEKLIQFRTTGMPFRISPQLKYFRTIVTDDGAFVIHVYIGDINA